MSDLMWNDPSVRQKWQDVAVHSDGLILGFFGPWRGLSNFPDAPAEFGGLLFPSSENAYQAAKVAPENRPKFLTCTAAESKRLWKGLSVFSPEKWDAVKFAVMQKIVFDKFTRNPDMRTLLLATGDRYLEETNWWKDTYWGVDYKTRQGENKLGIILMAVRAYLKSIDNPRRLVMLPE